MDPVVGIAPRRTVEAALLDVRVAAVRRHAPGVLEFALQPAGHRPLPAFEPGAHIDVRLPNGLTRSYSLIGEGDDGNYRICVALDARSRGGSQYMHGHVRAGTRLLVSPPRNLFRLVDDAPSVVLVAGGIGITPLIGMAMRCASLGLPWALHYSVARGPVPFAAELDALRDGETAYYHTRTAQPRRIDLGAVVKRAAAGTHFYCCGPASMLEAFDQATAGLAPSRVHVERFRPPEPASPGERAEDGFCVELARSRHVLQVPGNKSILEVLLDEGIDAAYACQRGICGLCEVRVLAGDVLHRDQVKTPDQHARESTMMICCSRARGAKLVIDI